VVAHRHLHSFPTRRSSDLVGMKRAEEMILSGRVYTAEEMHAAGVVDVLVEDGTGEAAVQDYIRRNERRRNGLQAVFSCRQHFHRSEEHTSELQSRGHLVCR